MPAMFVAKNKRRGVLEISTCVNPGAQIRALRELAQEAGWEIERIEGSRLVDRFAIIMPLTSSARTLGLVLKSGPMQGLHMTTWSHVEGSSGAIHKVEWRVPRQIAPQDFHYLVRHWTAHLPRAPFNWTFSERSRLGYLLPTYRRAKRTFTTLGVPTGKGQWPQSEEDLGPWPPLEFHTQTSFFEEE